MKDVTVGIKTFIRTVELERALSSLVGHGFARVVVADDGDEDGARQVIYEKYSASLPLTVLRLPFRSGIAHGRNQMVAACDTPYFLLMDDDFFLTGVIDDLLIILESSPELGGVSAMEQAGDGSWSSGAGNLHRFWGLLVHDVGFNAGRDHVRLPGGQSYFIYDMISNFTLFRRSALLDQAWDETFLIGREHMDFYLAHKQLGRWKFALCPDYAFGHASEQDGERAARYRDFRWNRQTAAEMTEYFMAKWGLRREPIWGLCHQPRGRALKNRLVHAALGVAYLAGHRGR